MLSIIIILILRVVQDTGSGLNQCQGISEKKEIKKKIVVKNESGRRTHTAK